jgi:hypothetical protein
LPVTVCLQYEPVRKRKNEPSNICWHCDQAEEDHGKACIWFDALYENRSSCRSCTQPQEQHRICDKFYGFYEQSCLYCGQPSELHELCNSFTIIGKVSNWCDICGRHKVDHTSHAFEVEIIIPDISKDDFESKRREVLTKRIEAQWLSASDHFQVS